MKYLANIHKGKRDMPRRLMIYGTHGIGKSTFAASAPSPIVISTEGGVDNIDVDSVEVKEYDEAIGVIGDIYSGDTGYQTIVIDTADWLEQLIYVEVCKEHQKDAIGNFGFGSGYKFALVKWREVLEGLDALRKERGMTIILVAHSQIEKFSNPETEAYNRYSPAMHRDSSAVLQQWCDEVFFATQPIAVKKTDEGFGKTASRGMSTGGREIRTVEAATHLAKNRIAGLPAKLPLDFAAYAEHAGIDITAPTAPTTAPTTKTGDKK